MTEWPTGRALLRALTVAGWRRTRAFGATVRREFVWALERLGNEIIDCGWYWP